MYSATIKFTSGNQRYTTSYQEYDIITWAARYGVTLAYRGAADIPPPTG